jgi:hypothetical protein
VSSQNGRMLMLFWLYGEIMSHETEQVEVDLKVDELMDAKGEKN